MATIIRSLRKYDVFTLKPNRNPHITDLWVVGEYNSKKRFTQSSIMY